MLQPNYLHLDVHLKMYFVKQTTRDESEALDQVVLSMSI